MDNNADTYSIPVSYDYSSASAWVNLGYLTGAAATIGCFVAIVVLLVLYLKDNTQQAWYTWLGLAIGIVGGIVLFSVSDHNLKKHAVPDAFIVVPR